MNLSHDTIATSYFVLSVVRRGDRFLLIHECIHGRRWYLPAGRVEPGENFITAAVRETLEEAGIPIAIEGLVRIEHTPKKAGHARVRVIFTARPTDDSSPKTVPDAESLEAGWFTLAEIEALPLRGNDVADILRYIAGGGAITPLTFLTEEGAPFVQPLP